MDVETRLQSRHRLDPAILGGAMRKALYFLGILDDSDLEWIISNGHKRRCSSGDILVKQGIALDSLFIVLSGQLAVVISGDSGRQTEIAQLLTGEVVGEMSFVDSLPPTATVKVQTDSAVLSIDRVQLQRKLESDTGFASRFYRALAVFLANRYRSTVAGLGYSDGADIDEDSVEADELALDVLDNVYMAGTRFKELQDRLARI